jgi:hypothetical protein
MKTRNAIFTANIGEGSDYLPAMLSAQYYASRHKIDFFVAEEPAIRFLYPCFEKRQGFRLFDMGYDRVLFLDRDILVTPDAPNIFECCCDVDTLYAFDESFPDETMERDSIVNGIKGTIQWPMNERGMYKYFNSGVVVISRDIKGFAEGYRDLPETPSMRRFPEQTSMNYLAFKRGIKFEDLDQRWNRMDMGIPDPENRRYESYFIHYAGNMAFIPNEDKAQTIRRDFIHFYGEEPLTVADDRLNYLTLPPESTGRSDEPGKECSICLLCDPESTEVNSYLSCLSVQNLPADYEVLFTEDCLERVETDHLAMLAGCVRTVVVMERLSFEQACVDIARQAGGRHLVFVKQPATGEEIAEAIGHLGAGGVNIAVAQGGKLIAVNRQALVECRSFDGLMNKVPLFGQDV